MTKQSQLDQAIEALQDELQKHVAADTKKAEKAFKLLRAELVEKVTSHADKDGKINRIKLNTLIKEFDAVLADAKINLFNEITDVVKGSAERALTETERIFFREVGTDLIARDLHNKVIDAVVEQQVNEQGDDRLLLSDRVWILTNDIHAELTKAVTTGVLKNLSIGALVVAVREVHENETWKIRRLVITEANNAHRNATGAAAEASKVVDAVKINDSHKPHRNHASHRCYVLARADNYGLGQGVYPKSRYHEIATPHPQCSAHISYVINPKYL